MSKKSYIIPTDLNNIREIVVGAVDRVAYGINSLRDMF